MASKKQHPPAKKATSARRPSAKAPAKMQPPSPPAKVMGAIGKAVAAVGGATAAAVEIVTKAHDIKESYEWLKPLLERVLSLSVRQGDAWAVEMQACTDPAKRVQLLNHQNARTALFVAVIERLMSKTPEQLAEHGALTDAEADAFSSVLLDRLETVSLDAPPLEIAQAIVSAAELSVLLKVKNYSSTPRPPGKL